MRIYLRAIYILAIWLMATEKATLGGGCFWCLEAAYQQIEGIFSIVSGYAGGEKEHPSYQEVCSGTSGHAEVIEIEFDNRLISFSELLEVFWVIHDPTTLNRQGADTGSQYRSVIFYQSAEQKAQAEQSIQEVAAKLFDNPIVTEISQAPAFYPAEEQHQNYYRNNPDQGYCVAIIEPKLKKLREFWLN